MRLSWLVCLVGILHAYAAHACGEWWLQDDERGHTVKFYIRSTFLETGPRPPGTAPTNRILLMEGQSPEQLHTEAGGRRQLQIVDQQVQLFGKPIGELRGAALVLGREAYQIAVTRNPAPPAHPEDREGRWLVEVRRDGLRVAHGLAMVMCLGGPQLLPEAQQELEIRRRVTYYLAWRQLLAPGQHPRPAAAGSPARPAAATPP